MDLIEGFMKDIISSPTFTNIEQQQPYEERLTTILEMANSACEQWLSRPAYSAKQTQFKVLSRAIGNYDIGLDRQEVIEELDGATEELVEVSTKFEEVTSRVKHRMCVKNLQHYGTVIYMFFIVIIIHEITISGRFHGLHDDSSGPLGALRPRLFQGECK